MPDGTEQAPDGGAAARGDDAAGRPWWASGDASGRAGPGPWQQRDASPGSAERPRGAAGDEPADQRAEAINDARARDWLAEGAELFGQVAREAALRVGVGVPEGGWTDEAVAPGQAAAGGRGAGRATRAARAGTDPPGAPHRVDTCGVCPLCSMIRVVAESRPEVVEHVAEATRHLTLALKAAVDARAGGWGQRGVERIDVD